MAWAESSTSAAEEILKSLRDPAYQVTLERFDRRAGLPGPPSQLRHLPTAIESTDGRLWFAVNNGVVWLDPARATNRTPSPSVSIQSVTADGKVYEMDRRPEFPAGTSNIQISYAAISLLNPEATRFHYRLRGMEDEWHEAGRATSVSYRNLVPGSYRLRSRCERRQRQLVGQVQRLRRSPSCRRITRPIGFGRSALASSWRCCGRPIGCVSGTCSDGSR